MPLTAAFIVYVFAESTRQQDGFTIELLMVVDTLVQRRLEREGISLHGYANYISSELNHILGQLERPGSVVIVGVLTTTENKEPYIKPKNGEALRCSSAKVQASNYVKEENINTLADVVLVVIGHEMYCYPNRVRTLGHGTTSRKSACKQNNVIVVSGHRPHKDVVMTVAHELGHALGAPHDGTETSIKCPRNDGHIMATTEKARQKDTYSSCTKQSIKAFLLTKEARCLFRRRCPNSAIPNGELLTRIREQCRADMKDTDIFLYAMQNEGTCVLTCHVLADQKVEATFETKAPDWVNCVDGETCKVCNNGFCV